MKVFIFCIISIFLLNVNSKANSEYIVFLKNNDLYYEAYKSDVEHKILNLSTFGNSKKHDPKICKAEFDISDSNIAHCYIYSELRASISILSIITFSLITDELLCYEEIFDKSSKVYFEKSNCFGLILNGYDHDYTQFHNGFVYTINSDKDICRIPPILVTTLGYKYYPAIYHHPDCSFDSQSKFTSWGFIYVDLSPNEDFLVCDFLGEKTAFYWGKPNNISDIYEFIIKDSTGQKIIEGGRNSNYSASSEYIIFEKVKQTWGYNNYENLGYYIYDRKSRGTTFFKFCNVACFIRPAADYLPSPY